MSQEHFRLRFTHVRTVFDVVSGWLPESWEHGKTTQASALRSVCKRQRESVQRFRTAPSKLMLRAANASGRGKRRLLRTRALAHKKLWPMNRQVQRAGSMSAKAVYLVSWLHPLECGSTRTSSVARGAGVRPTDQQVQSSPCKTRRISRLCPEGVLFEQPGEKSNFHRARTMKNGRPPCAETGRLVELQGTE